jgi:hypothetical protein
MYVFVSLLSEVDKVVILCEDLSGRSREVEADLRDAGAEVIDAE